MEEKLRKRASKGKKWEDWIIGDAERHDPESYLGFDSGRVITERRKRHKKNIDKSLLTS